LTERKEGSPGPSFPFLTFQGHYQEMPMKKNREEKFRVSFEPNFFDLIKMYFPPVYAKRYCNPEIVRKEAEAALLKNLPGSHDYHEMCLVHDATFKLKQEDPYITPSEVIRHPSIKKIVGRRYNEETLRKWIRPIMENKPGRPSKRPAIKAE
jgi:hypothetical protein